MSRGEAIVRRLKRISKIDIGVAAVTVVLCLSAVLLWPVWRAADPEFAAVVAIATRGHDEGDPWGRKYKVFYEQGIYRSAGPNGLDEGGEGDDIDVLGTSGTGGQTKTTWTTANGARATPLAEAMAYAGEAALLALAALLCLPYSFLRIAPRPVSAPDKIAAIAFSLFVGVAIACVGLGILAAFSQDTYDSLSGMVWIPLPLAAVGTGAFGAGMAMLLVWIVHAPQPPAQDEPLPRIPPADTEAAPPGPLGDPGGIP